MWLKEQSSHGMDIFEDEEIAVEVLAALKMSEKSYWPLLWDPDGTGLHWLIKKCQRGKQKVVCIQQNYRDQRARDSDLKKHSSYTQILEAVKNGDIIILYETEVFDSYLDALFSRRIKTDGERDLISIAGVDVPFDYRFQLYVIASTNQNVKLDTELLAKCSLIDFSNNKQTLQQLFQTNIFRKENPRSYMQLMCTKAKRQYNVRNADETKSDILKLLTTSDSSILDKNEMTALLLAKKVQFKDIKAEGKKLNEIIEHLQTESLRYCTVSVYCNILFRVAHKFDFSLHFFLSILNTALENSNKSKSIDKRLRYIQDTITYSIYNQVAKSLNYCDRLHFSFILALEFLTTKESLAYSPASVITELWQMHEKKKNIIGCLHSEVQKNADKNCIWLQLHVWSFFSKIEVEVPELKGICEDLRTSYTKWELVLEAKEPDNLPLHEPWHSQLSKFAHFVVIAALRPDKIMELVRSFITDVVGFKFVDTPTGVDIGRVLTDAINSPVIIFQSDMCNTARIIKDYAICKTIDISSPSIQQSSNIIHLCEEFQRSGKKWLLLENLHEEVDKSLILKMHSKINQSFHSNYRLIIVTKECKEFSSLVMKNCVKIVVETPHSFRDLLLKNFDSAAVRRITQLWERYHLKLGSPRENERQYMRILYGLCMFHSMANFRTRYGSRGGWNCVKGFDLNDLDCATEYLEVTFHDFNFNRCGVTLLYQNRSSHCADHNNWRRKLLN